MRLPVVAQCRRRLNKVQSWQLKQPSQRNCKNLPLDEQVLLATMGLIDMTMAPELIRKWIAKVKPFLYCEDPKRKEFRKVVKEVQKRISEEHDIEVEEEEGSQSE